MFNITVNGIIRACALILCHFGSRCLTHAQYTDKRSVLRMRSTERRLALCVCHWDSKKKKKKKPGTSENKDKIKNNCRDAGEEISYHRLDFIWEVKWM